MVNIKINTEHTEKLIQAYASDYMGRVYYFCLKKTGNVIEAEDLSSEIAINIFISLRKGIVPVSFSAWVWKIARNKYSEWADKKNKRNKSVSGADISELDITVDDETLSDIIRCEDLKLLRRELAFISSEYRNILVAYYVENIKVRDIARTLNLPDGTVKTKLFKSRSILKEGMNMAREFGTRSYKPENVNFAASGNQPSGLPWNVVQRQIPKNILLEAHNNPSTIEELAIELGVAVPYMEEEIKILLDATLLKEVGKKYITNFFIADKDCQVTVYNLQKKDSKEKSKIIDAIIFEIFDSIEALRIMKNGMSRNDFKWFLYTYIIDYVINKNTSYNIWNCSDRPDGGKWGFMGFEEHNLISENTGMSHNQSGNVDAAMFSKFDYFDYNMKNRVGFMDCCEYVLFLADVIKNNRNVSSFTSTELLYWEKIKDRFAHSDTDGNVIPDIAVFMPGVMQEFKKIIESSENFPKLKELVSDLFNEVKNTLKKNSNPILHEQMDYYTSMMMCNIRMMAVRDAVESGILILPENPDKSTVSMWLEIV